MEDGKKRNTIHSAPKTPLTAMVFLAVIVGGFLAWIVSDPALPVPEDLNDVLSGRYSLEFDEFVEDGHLLREAGLHVVSALRLAVFREGFGPVVIDREYRLYTREEFEHHRRDDRVLHRRVRTVLDTAEQLRGRGIGLVVVLVPSKARVNGETGARFGFLHDTSPEGRPLADHRRYAQAVRMLRDGDVILVDPRETLEKTPQAFLSTDTHWSPRGALAVAEQVAEATAELTIPVGDRARTALNYPETGFERIPAAEVNHRGDLMQFVPLGRWTDTAPLPQDRVTPLEVKQVEEARSGGSDAGELTLFETPDIPITLVGTSFSVGEIWNFAGALQYALQADVLNVAEEGRGPFVPMSRYLAGDTFREIIPTIVIWEIPERYLTLPGMGGEQEVSTTD